MVRKDCNIFVVKSFPVNFIAVYYSRIFRKSIEVRAEEAEDGDKGTSIEDMRTYRGGFQVRTGLKMRTPDRFPIPNNLSCFCFVFLPPTQMLSEEDTSHMTSELERIGKSDFVRRGILRME